MSEDLDISVPEMEPDVSAVAPDMGADAGGMVPGVAPEAAPAVEQEPEITEDTSVLTNAGAATQLNTRSTNDSLTAAAQDVNDELNGRVPDDGRTAVTEVGRQEQEAAKKESRQDAAEALQSDMEERQERRKAWMESKHQMGDLEMSGADLEKLLNFVKNPAVQRKIEAVLKSKGMSQSKIDKAQQEMAEYTKLKEKEKEEGLTEQEKARLQEINKSQEFRVYTQAAAEVAQKNGFQYSDNNNRVEVLAIKAATDRDAQKELRSNVIDSLATPELKAPLTSGGDKYINATEENNFGRSHFSTAPGLKPAFTVSASMPDTTANNKPIGPASDDEFEAAAAVVVAQNYNARAIAAANVNLNS